MKSYLLRVLKVLVSILGIIVPIYILPALYLGINVDWIFIAGLFTVIGLINPIHYKGIEVELPIEDKHNFKEYVHKRLDLRMWEVLNQNNDIIIVKPRFDKPYSFIFKEKVYIDIKEDHAILSGSKIYIDNIKDTLEGKDLLRNKKIVRYLGTAFIILMFSAFLIFNLELVDSNRLRMTYNEFRVSRIEKINFEENLVFGNTLENINNNGMATENEDYIFYVKDLGVYKANKDFSNKESIINRSSGYKISNLNIIDDWLFFSDGKKIRRMNIDDGKTDTIYRMGYTLQFHVLDNWIYFIDVIDDFNVYRMTVNGESIQKVINTPVYRVALHNNRIYYSYSSNGENYLKFMDLATNEYKTLANIHPKDMILEDNAIYYIDYNDSKIYEYNILNGEVIALADKEVFMFTKDENSIYFVEKVNEMHFKGNGLYKLCLTDYNELMINNDLFMHGGLSIVGDWLVYESTEDYRYESTFKRMSLENNIVYELE